MSGKRIQQKVKDNGTVETYTQGNPQGSLDSFDVRLVTSPTHHKQATEFVLELADSVTLQLDGRKARTLLEVLNRHYDAVGDMSW